MKASKTAQEKLLALQALDSSLIQLEHKAKSLPVAKLLDEKIIAHATARDLCVAAETEKSDIQHELSRSEIDVEQVVSRIEKDEKRLASGTGTPKELEQIQHERGTLAKRRSELEEVELEIMVRIDDVSKRITDLQKQLASFEAELARVQSELEIEVRSLDSAKQSSLNAREALAPQIDKELLALYEKIRSSSDGLGAAQLVGDSCGGCHLKLNAAEMEKIKSLSDDEVVRCEECRRILIRVK